MSQQLVVPSPVAPPMPDHPSATGVRWFGSGRSVDPDARTAGLQAAGEAVAGRSAALLVVFCSATVDLPAMLAGVRQVSGDAVVLGCTGISPYSDGGADTSASTVVVSALGGDGLEISLRVAEDASTGRRAAGERVAEAAEDLHGDHRLLLMLCDGLTQEHHEIVRGAYSVVGATVPLAGACSADDFLYEQTFQFYVDATGAHVLSDAVVAVAIGSPAPIGIGIAHGWRRYGEPMLVTDSSGGHVRAINGRPALDVFLEQHRGEGEAPTDTDSPEFRRWALGRPLGMSRRSGEDIRIIHAGDRADGSIICLADVPQGALLWTMRSDQPSLVDSIGIAYDDAVAGLGGAPPLGLMTFDCGVRHLLLEADGVAAEVEKLRGRSAGTPFAGFYTMGELARSHGSRGMHHMTVVVLAFA